MLIKIDLLATMALSKIRTCLDLLIEYDYIPKGKNLRETYESAIGVYNLDRENPEMWKMVWNNEISNLFQFDKQSGIQGISLTKPKTLEDLAVLNAAIRLMSSDKGRELPLEKYTRFRKDPAAWEREMDSYGLTKEQKELMHEFFDYSYGVAVYQEDLYRVATHPDIANMSLGDADRLRKAVAKKDVQGFKDFEIEFFNRIRELGSDENLCRYVWEEVVRPQAG